MEQIRLENEQIEVTVNIHGAELRSLKVRLTDRNICGMQMQNTGEGRRLCYFHLSAE